MPRVPAADEELFTDREVRDSIMIIRRQRTIRFLIAIVGILAALGVAAGAVYYSYQGEFDVTKGHPAQGP